MAEITILEFLEDIGQQKFMESLIRRMAEEKGVAVRLLEPGNATGGRGRVLTELRRFLRDVSPERTPDLMIAAVDANCKGKEARSDIEEAFRASEYGGRYVMAVPIPHIECWYLADPQGFQQQFGGKLQKTPEGKCKKDEYKRDLANAFAAAGIKVPLGGVEYGAEVVESMDLYKAGRNVPSFKHFVEELGKALVACARGEEP